MTAWNESVRPSEDVTEGLNNLSLNESLLAKAKQAQLNGVVKSTYVPPARRRAGAEPSQPQSAGYRDNFPSAAFGGNRQAGNPARSNGTGMGGFTSSNRYPASSHYGGTQPGQGSWQNGKHVIGAPNMKLERQLFVPKESKEGFSNSSGINFDKYDDIPVDVSDESLVPLLQFTSPPLDAHLLSNIKLAQYETPTPVQKYSIPIVTSGRDLMACAQTGSGKTGGFLFPILSLAFEQGPKPLPENARFHNRKAYPTTLILAPTRELVSQIHEEVRKFAYRSWVRPCLVYGGADIGNQSREIERGCDLLTATPGRLVDMISRGKISLANIKFLVLDEADRMLDMGFEPQIRQIVKACDMPPVEERQTLMFSATFPRDIQDLARDFMKEYVFLSVGRVGSTSENITQRFEYVEDHEKQSYLIDILSTIPRDGLILIFTETKRMADLLCDYLLSANFPATSIHGDRSQRERERALQMFRAARTPIMVATAVAARGLDIPNVTHVINYDLPTDIDDYVHRIGRTGRAGNVGQAVSFFNRGNKSIARDMIEILREAKQTIPDFLEKVSKEAAQGSGMFGRGNSRGGYGRGGGRSSGSGTRDYRKYGAGGGNNNSSQHGWGGGNFGYDYNSSSYGNNGGYSNNTNNDSGSNWW